MVETTLTFSGLIGIICEQQSWHCQIPRSFSTWPTVSAICVAFPPSCPQRRHVVWQTHRTVLPGFPLCSGFLRKPVLVQFAYLPYLLRSFLFKEFAWRHSSPTRGIRLSKFRLPNPSHNQQRDGETDWERSNNLTSLWLVGNLSCPVFTAPDPHSRKEKKRLAT